MLQKVAFHHPGLSNHSSASGCIVCRVLSRLRPLAKDSKQGRSQKNVPRFTFCKHSNNVSAGESQGLIKSHLPPPLPLICPSPPYKPMLILNCPDWRGVMHAHTALYRSRRRLMTVHRRYRPARARSSGGSTRCCCSRGASLPEQTPDEGSWEIISIRMSSGGG